MTQNESESHPPAGPEPKGYSTRRDFLLQTGVVLNVIAGFMIGIPVVGYLLSSLIRRLPPPGFPSDLFLDFRKGKCR